MTDKELKNKIVEVVNQWHMFQNRDINGHTIWLTNDSEKLAEALIAEGIGDVKEAEHRAEVAERALKLDCYDKARTCYPNCGRERIRDVFYEEYIKQAEKELAEGKEENNAKNQRE